MSNQPVSEASKKLPFKAYRNGSYVGDDVRVVISVMGSDDGTFPTLIDQWTNADGTANLAGMLEFPFVDNTAWDWGCEPRDEFSCSASAVGFLEDFDIKPLEKFAKENPLLQVVVSYDSNRYNGIVSFNRGKQTQNRHTINRWSVEDDWGSNPVPYSEYVKVKGEGGW